MNPDLTNFLVDFTTFLYEQFLLAASDNARPEDKSRLLELMYAQHDDLTLTEFWDNEAKYYGEILRIGNNTLLQMSFNLWFRIVTGLVESGVIQTFSYPIPLYQEINGSLIEAVCSKDRARISTLLKEYKGHMIEAYQRFLSDVSKYCSMQGE